MAVEENKVLIRRYTEEAWNKGNLAIVDELIAPNHTTHTTPPDRKPSREGEPDFVKQVRAEWPDIRFTIEDQWPRETRSSRAGLCGPPIPVR